MSSAFEWLVKTHVGWIREVPTVDLSLLGGARLARRVVREIKNLSDQIETGAVAFNTGAGSRGSLGPHSAMGKAVRDELERICAERGPWKFIATSHTQYTFIIDPEKAPQAATNDLGTLFYVLAGAFGLAVLAAVMNMFYGLLTSLGLL
jgi:hypothetical protein